MKGNHFKGPIPKQICNLKYFHVLDFSQNNLSGDIPACIHNMGSDLASYIFLEEIHYHINVQIIPNTMNHFSTMPNDEERFSFPIQYIDFATKERSYTYKGDIINNKIKLEMTTEMKKQWSTS